MSRANGTDAFSLVYIKPWTRIGPYIVGLYTGYLLYRAEGRVRMNKVTFIPLCDIVVDIELVNKEMLYRRTDRTCMTSLFKLTQYPMS